MSWLEGIVYGLISGLSTFLPISVNAHQALMQSIFGLGKLPLLDMLINIALLLSVIIESRSILLRYRREQMKAASRRRNRSGVSDSKILLDMRLVKTAAVPMVIGTLLLLFVSPEDFGLPAVALFLVINGVILYIPEHIRHGNKDSRMMSRLDSFIMGIAGALSVLPGISRIGASMSSAVIRGADRQQAFHWSLLLSIPGIALMICGNILEIVRVGIGALDFVTVLIYMLSMIAAFGGGYFCINLMRLLSARTEGAGFAYYSWGAALLAFILYLL